MSDYRPRIRSRLSQDVHERLMVRAARPDMSVPKILDEALRGYFDGKVHENRNTALLRRLELMSRHDHRQTRDIAVIQEALALFVQYFFTVMPDLLPGDKDARAAKGVAHFNDYLAELSSRMEGGGRNVKNALEDVLVTDTDFFTTEEIERFASFDRAKQTVLQGGDHASTQ